MELLIVAYHHFGDENEYQAGIYPVSSERFARQLDIVGSHYDFISENDLSLALQKKSELPEKCCLVTFDDGLSCQYRYAVPILKEKSIPAVFFICTQPHTDKKAITVDKIHFLLASISIDELLSELAVQYTGVTGKKLNWGKIGIAKISDWYRYDDEKTGRFKFFLNYQVSPDVSKKIVDNIFRIRCHMSEEDFCGRFYLSSKDLIELDENPLFSLGLHTHTHFNICGRDKKFIKEDITKNYEIIRDLFKIKNIRGISFPFGLLSNEEFECKLSGTLEKFGLLYGVTSRKAINNDFQNPFLLSRFNTNDLPAGKRPIISFT
ncbi:polysaccharide deacetylase family protein [Candidatus Wolfebacteria bacterium]|nr:polysaccharide deacetylase family protein [Candidatus Wolfebacteria bacterium]